MKKLERALNVVHSLQKLKKNDSLSVDSSIIDHGSLAENANISIDKPTVI